MLPPSFPARKTYCTASCLDTAGPCLARPWQLSWRPDFGLAGCSEPDQLLLLSELILSESFLGNLLVAVQLPVVPVVILICGMFPGVRFRTNADLGGVEKISITKVSKEWLEREYTPMKPLNGCSLVKLCMFFQGVRKTQCFR